jgi:protein O-mannosyl-transferase
MAKKPNNRPAPAATRPQAAKPQPQATSKTAAPIEWFTSRNLWIALGILCILLYINTLQGGYVLDDVMVLKDNNFVKQGFGGIGELFTTPHMRGYLIIPNDLYRPLSLVMFAIEYQLFGLSPAVNHFFSVLTFAGCTIMLFLFLDKFFNRQRTVVAFIAAFIFALHPLHTEVVANIKSRDELLCYFFAFWSLNLFMSYMKEGKMMSLLLGTATLFLAYLSKETVIAFLAIIPLIFFFIHNDDRKRALLITGGTVLATAVFLAIRMVVLNKYNADQGGVPVDFMDNSLAGAHSVIERFCTEITVLGRYLWLMFIPYPLLCNRSYNAIPFSGPGDIWFWVSIAAYLFLLYVAIARFVKDKKDILAFSIVFFFATLSLFSNLPFLMGAEMAERFAFFASTAVCIAGALAVDHFILKGATADLKILKTGKVMMILLPMLLIFGGMTVDRNADWKSDFLLYKTDVEKSPNDSRLWQYLGTAIAENLYPDEPDTAKRRQMDAEALGYLHRSLAIYPQFTEAHVELGRIYDREKMYDSAVFYDAKALAMKPMNATANNNLGSVLITMGHYREAIPYLVHAAQANPNLKFTYVNLARCYKQLQIFDSAVMFYNQYLTMEPNDYDARKELGLSCFMQQRYDLAEPVFKQLITMKPDDVENYNTLGAVYLNTKRYPPAIEQFRKAISVNQGYINAYSNLGRCYYLTAQYQAAIDIINKELQLNPKNGRDIPYIALSYQKMGNMEMARKYEAIAKQVYKDFKLD